MASTKHRWTYDEDLYCCTTCVQYYAVEKNSLPVAKLLEDLSARFPDIPENSLKTKIQNIKQILEEGIDNTLTVGALKNYSQQNRKAMTEALANI